jgi:hypothetical protein
MSSEDELEDSSATIGGGWLDEAGDIGESTAFGGKDGSWDKAGNKGRSTPKTN